MRTIPLDATTSKTSGKKAATLATLRAAGIDVPDGFVVPMAQYRRHHEQNLAPHEMEPRLVIDIEESLDRLIGQTPEAYVAVRSSASEEDGHQSSGAGQHDTVLAVRGIDAVIAAVTQCWDSLHSARAEAYRQPAPMAGTRAPAMAVLVQRFVDAEVSGVLFTQDPRVIEATPGLGAPLVSGHITPDSWTVDDTGIIARRIGTRTHRIDRGEGDLFSTSLEPAERPCLEDSRVHELDRLGTRVSQVLGYPADVEWAVTGDRIHTLQARPITASLTPRASRSNDQADPGWIGIPASPGRVTGTTCVLHGPRDFHRFVRGDILVCRATDPAWTPLFRHAAGVITETGGLLSHAAIVARELHLPAVLSIPSATSLFPDGTLLTMDGATGQVHIS